MKILSIDSSAGMAAVALCEREEMLYSLQVFSGHTHSETLLPMVENALKAHSMTAHDVDIYAVCVGPGSYTGLRIGVATVKGLASGTAIPCVPVSTLEALARNCIGYEGLICPVMDARRDQLYTALFRSDGRKTVRLTEDRFVTLEELAGQLSGYEEKIYLVGDGYDKAKKVLPYAQETPVMLRYQNAYSVAMCALEKYENDPEKDFGEGKLLPIYLRTTQAERERLEKEKSADA